MWHFKVYETQFSALSHTLYNTDLPANAPRLLLLERNTFKAQIFGVKATLSVISSGT